MAIQQHFPVFFSMQFSFRPLNDEKVHKNKFEIYETSNTRAFWFDIKPGGNFINHKEFFLWYRVEAFVRFIVTSPVSANVRTFLFINQWEIILVSF